jgi:hypothetical protein
MDGWILEGGDESLARGLRVGPNVLPVSRIDREGEKTTVIPCYRKSS